MKNTSRMWVLAAAASALCFASATTTHAAFDSSELRCRKGIAKSMLKAIAAADKASTQCHKSRHSGKEPAITDCNDLGSAPANPGAADGKRRFVKAQQKLIDTPASKCSGLDEDVLTEFTSCPEPCDTTLGLNNPLTTLDEVAQCLACYAGDIVGTKNASLLGSPDPLLMTGDDAPCAQAIGKGYSKYLASILKTRTRCQNRIEKDGGMGLDADCQTSGDPDGKGRIARGLGKAEDAIAKKCSAATLVNVGACSTVDVSSLQACAQADTETADTAAFSAHYELAGTGVCPIGFRSTVLAGNGAGGSTSNTFLDVGWTGVGHKFDLPGGVSLEADITCPNESAPCGNCTIDGVTQSGAIYDRFLRCTNDFSVRCDEPFANDIDDCGGSPCTYVLGPPLPLSAAGNPACSINALAVDVSGSVVVDSGDFDLNLALGTRVFTPGVVLQPCPVCEGDITPNDDVQDGTCAGGSPNDGNPCDTHGFDETFASATNDKGLSLDCAPGAVTNISGEGLQIDLPLTTGSHSLGANNACDAPLGAYSCFCGQCSGDTLVACRDDAECAGAGIGSCTAIGGNGDSRQPNECLSFSNCVDVGDENGECSDVNQGYCDGIAKANGGGFITCLANGDCDATCAPIGGCGVCGSTEARPCFLDPIEGTGIADPSAPTMVGSFCLSPTISLGINSATGNPGPGRVAISQDVEFIY